MRRLTPLGRLRTRVGARLPPALKSSKQLAREAILHGAMQVPTEFASLLKLLRRRALRVVVEIGTARGGAFLALCQAAGPGSTLVSIDLPGGPFGHGYRKKTKTFLQSAAREDQSVHFLALDSHLESTKASLLEILSGRPIDFLFIDGDHTYEGVQKDFAMYSPLVEPGGLIAFHDIVPGNREKVGGVPDFWKEIKANFESLEFVDSWAQGGYGLGVISLPPKAGTPSL